MSTYGGYRRMPEKKTLYRKVFLYTEKGYRDTNQFADETEWLISIQERETLTPEIHLEHASHSCYVDLTVGVCECGVKPPEILAQAMAQTMAEAPYIYSAVAMPDGRIRSMKTLADGWLLHQNKQQREPSLHHVCNTTHPGYLYYGKGIPLSHITITPRPDKCKTCEADIPKSVRMALLMLRSKLKL